MKTKIIIAMAAIVLFGCKKNGTGGDADIHANIKHHSLPIKGATLYVKFNATELPSDPTTDYDLKEVGCPLCTDIHVEGLRPGNYFLYATGYDSTIMQTVRGGIGVKIKWNERKEDMEINIPVVE
jgi:hypothetical protein